MVRRTCVYAGGPVLLAASFLVPNGRIGFDGAIRVVAAFGLVAAAFEWYSRHGHGDDPAPSD